MSIFEGLARLMEDPELIGAGGDETQLRITAALRAGSTIACERRRPALLRSV